jgi:hypothetical protein
MSHSPIARANRGLIAFPICSNLLSGCNEPTTSVGRISCCNTASRSRRPSSSYHGNCMAVVWRVGWTKVTWLGGWGSGREETHTIPIREALGAGPRGEGTELAGVHVLVECSGVDVHGPDAGCEDRVSRPTTTVRDSSSLCDEQRKTARTTLCEQWRASRRTIDECT